MFWVPSSRETAKERLDGRRDFASIDVCTHNMAGSGHHAHLDVGRAKPLGESLGVTHRADAVEPSVDDERRTFYFRELGPHDAGSAQHLDRAAHRIELVRKVRVARRGVAD